jgi:hypothetical protein
MSVIIAFEADEPIKKLADKADPHFRRESI